MYTCTQNITVRIQGNMNAMWHPNDVIGRFFLPHIRFNRDMMLVKDNTPRHSARSTQVILVTNKHTQYGLKSQQARVGHWSSMCLHSRCNQIAGSSCVLLIRCAMLQQFLHIHIISWGTMYIAVIATAGERTVYWNEIKYDLYWYCSFCF